MAKNTFLVTKKYINSTFTMRVTNYKMSLLRKALLRGLFKVLLTSISYYIIVSRKKEKKINECLTKKKYKRLTNNHDFIT